MVNQSICSVTARAHLSRVRVLGRLRFRVRGQACEHIKERALMTLPQHALYPLYAYYSKPYSAQQIKW